MGSGALTRGWDVRVAAIPELAAILASDFEHEGRGALAAHACFSVALPGGSVATELFPRLSRAAFDWSNVELFWVDERAVLPSDPESNYGRALPLLLRAALVPPERVHRMPTDAADGPLAARRYARELEDAAGTPPRLDYVLLGVGEDGHVASLFPGHPVLDAPATVAVIDDAPKPPPRRMTLTLPVLSGAARIVVAAFGRSKARAISDALTKDDSALPLAKVIRGSARVMFLLDQGAANLS